jgi:hypothetical protein
VVAAVELSNQLGDTGDVRGRILGRSLASPGWFFWGRAMNRKDNPPGIKVRVAKDGVVQFLDHATGRWLANVRWRPRGVVWVELAQCVKKALVRGD